MSDHAETMNTIKLNVGGREIDFSNARIIKELNSPWKLGGELHGISSVLNEALQNPQWAADQMVSLKEGDDMWNLKLSLTTHYRPIINPEETGLEVEIVVQDASRATPVAGILQFVIPNVDFGLADRGTSIPVMSAQFGAGKALRMDHCVIQIGDANWILRQLYVRGDDLVIAEELSSFKDIQESRFWALEIPVDQMTESDAKACAEDICWLLCLAAGSRVMWNSIRIRTAAGSQMLQRNSSAVALNPNTSCQPIRNWGDQKLKRYLESAWPIYQEDPEWWKVTLNWFAILHENYTIEVGGVICSMLFDRISRFRLKGVTFEKQIDKDLDEKLGKRNSESWTSAGEEITKAVATFCNDWKSVQSDALLDKIREWNNEPSYSKKIDKALDGLPVEKPGKELIGPRHLLVHDGRLELKGDMTPMGYFSGVLKLVTSILLAMLNYRGAYFVLGLGEQQLVSSEAPDDSNNTNAAS